jgi:anaerobic magnesium-protoporphyrin IX monomethyl ester cyclase
MKIALVNPNWTFEGSIYFGCREAHLPLELGYSRALLERDDHEVLLVDGLLEQLSNDEITKRVVDFGCDLSVVATANSYLFWRCAQPELRIPKQLIQRLQKCCAMTAAVGPHSSTTPKAALEKLGADFVVIGECEEPLQQFAKCGNFSEVPSICYWNDGDVVVQGSPYASNMKTLPALKWPAEFLKRHRHHHHRFETAPHGIGAEMEFSRGCPYRCTFCAKENFRNLYRKRNLETVLQELDGLLDTGVQYIYFIDEIFLPDRPLLESLVDRNFKFGIQTRIDLWKEEMIDLLSAAGCVSIEAGVESITEEGRTHLDKNCKLTTDELTDRLIYAKKRIPFVQANLLESESDDIQDIERWRKHLHKFGVWSNEPVPLFPYPGSPEYTRLWGPADDYAWERAVHHYLSQYKHFSDIQEQIPLELEELEAIHK